MNLYLSRQFKRADGIFSALNSDERMIAWCLDHAYPVGIGNDPEPKLYDGVFTCVRGMHRLPWHSTSDDPFLIKVNGKVVQINGADYIEFETFEITGIDGHSGIVYHWGSYNKNSDGCVLTGRALIKGDPWMITDTRDTFTEFMKLQEGVDSFQLTVRS